MAEVLFLLSALALGFGGVAVLLALAGLADGENIRRPSVGYTQWEWGRRYRWLWMRYGVPCFVLGLAGVVLLAGAAR